jgi:hypothetical protein
MDLQLLKNSTGNLEIYPGRLVTSATVEVFKPDGAILVASSAATIDATQTTLQGQTQGNPNRLHLDDVTGFVVGRKYLITGTDGETFQVTVSAIDTSNNHILVNVPPPFDIQNGDTIKGTRVSYSIASSYLGTLDTYYRAEFTCSTASETFRETLFFDVVRMQFNIKSPELVKRLITFQFPSASSRFESGMIEEIAERAHRMILDKIRSTGRFPHLYGSPDMFEEAYGYAVRLVLADFGMIPNAGAVDIIDYMNVYQDKLRTALEIASQGNGYDADNDGAIDKFERMNWSTKIVL